jgi:energy-converting hydrogenase Eha subunit G
VQSSTLFLRLVKVARVPGLVVSRGTMVARAVLLVARVPGRQRISSTSLTKGANLVVDLVAKVIKVAKVKLGRVVKVGKDEKAGDNTNLGVGVVRMKPALTTVSGGFHQIVRWFCG